MPGCHDNGIRKKNKLKKLENGKPFWSLFEQLVI